MGCGRQVGPGRARRRVGIVTLICGVYVAFTLTWEALRFTPIGGWWPFELLDIFGLAMFAPIPLLFLLALLCANRTAGLCLLVPVSVLAWDYGALFLPRRVPADGRPLRVMTANLLISSNNLRPVRALIGVEQPDIVALQELGPEMAKQLAQALRSRYPYQILVPSEAPDGLGILSRYPIRQEPDPDGHDRVCKCQRVTVDVDGRAVTFVNVHPLPPAVGFRRLGPVPVPIGFDTSWGHDHLLNAK